MCFSFTRLLLNEPIGPATDAPANKFAKNLEILLSTTPTRSTKWFTLSVSYFEEMIKLEEFEYLICYCLGIRGDGKREDDFELFLQLTLGFAYQKTGDYR